MFVQGAILVQNINYIEAMLLANRKIIPVVRRRHFQAARAKIRRHILVRDDGNLHPSQGDPNMQAMQCRVALVFRVDRNGAVGHDGFRARSGYRQVGSWSLYDFVAHVIQLRLYVFVQHFFVAQRGLCLWIPVDHALTAIDMSLFVEINKNF